MDLMFTFNKTVDRLPMASSVHLFGYGRWPCLDNRIKLKSLMSMLEE